MAEWTDTTTGVVDTSGYPPPNGVPSKPNNGSGGSDTHAYMEIVDSAGARLGTHLRFRSGHNTISDWYIFDFFGVGWPNDFSTLSTFVVRTSGAGGVVANRYKYNDPVNLQA